MSEGNEFISKNMKILVYVIIGAIIVGGFVVSILIGGETLALLQIILGIVVISLFAIMIFAKMKYDAWEGSSDAVKDTMMAISPYSIYVVLGIIYMLQVPGIPTEPGDPGSLDAYALAEALLGVLTGLGGMFGAIILCVYGILYYAMPGLGILTGTTENRELGGTERAFAIRSYAKQGIKDVAIGLMLIYGSLSIIAWMSGLAFIS